MTPDQMSSKERMDYLDKCRQEGKGQMKRRWANLLLRLAFRIFRRYHSQLPKELNGIIWGEMTRKSEPAKDYSELWCIEGEGKKRLCSMCVSELEEDRERYATVERWLKGEALNKRGEK